MAEVSIDIDAMTSLVAAIGSARGSIPSAAGSVRGRLSQVWLSAPAVDKVAGGALETSLESAHRDLNRRLSLARLIQASTPGISVVTFDDSVLSTANDAEVQRRVSRVLELMKVDGSEDFGKGREPDPELMDLLDQNSLDPYFAKALAAQLEPDALRMYLHTVNLQRTTEMRNGADAVKAFDAGYERLLSGLGTTLGLASRGTGDLAVPGMTRTWTDFITDKGKYRGIGAVNALSLVIGRGQWSDDFLVGVYGAVREVEGDSGVGQWTLGVGSDVYDPDLSISPGAHLANDPMTGILKALQSNPGAMQRLFTGGDTTTVSANGQDVQVNKSLYDFIRNRGELSDETVGAFMAAMSSAIGSPPVEGQTAFQPLMANDLKNIGQALQDEAKKAEEEAGPWWQRWGHTLLDFVGMIPVIGEPVDFVNGVWYYANGDVIDGSLSMGAMIPFAGWAATGGKWAKAALSAEELAALTKLARDGKTIRTFDKEGNLVKDLDLLDPASFDPANFLTPSELTRWSGSREFMQRVIAGNRFNAFLNPRYAYSEIALSTGRVRPFRLDSYTPGEAIVSRKLTQLGAGGVSQSTAFKYIDEFAEKYPEGTLIANTKKNRDLGIAGQPLTGKMELQVPPQAGKIDDSVLQRAFENNIHIVDINGVDYTKALFDAARKGK